ncbi:PREDICTED: membrane-spanning 4-domains subfamily A member 6B-like [Hipposideros armiger]|uniref:Membrane-spanning 4-domains subfamily A member 6B-like n=1 Tax=Hipposideros armiger TaxID=186990 RepID=A0A8B7SA71_HIPAR|nr:PREDICTED: membrane-spanning 4-domains subfamily A member 6B-like [Hipposideros armiger]
MEGPPQPTETSPVTDTSTAVQIFSNFMVMALGLLLACVPFPHHFSSPIVTLVKSGFPFFFVSGLLSVIMEKRASKHLAWASLATNLLSLITASVGCILVACLMAQVLTAWKQCELDVVSGQLFQGSYANSGDKAFKCNFASSTLLGLLSDMLLFTVVEFCVAILTSVLWWRQARSGVPGVVRFLAQRNTMATNALPKAFAAPDPGVDELVASKERE